MKRDSQVQEGGCYRKWIGGTLQICKILNLEKNLLAGEKLFTNVNIAQVHSKL